MEAKSMFTKLFCILCIVANLVPGNTVIGHDTVTIRDAFTGDVIYQEVQDVTVNDVTNDLTNIIFNNFQ